MDILQSALFVLDRALLTWLWSIWGWHLKGVGSGAQLPGCEFWLPLPCCVSLGKTVNLSVSQFLHIGSRDISCENEMTCHHPEGTHQEATRGLPPRGPLLCSTERV